MAARPVGDRGNFRPEEWNRAAEMFAQGIETAPTFSPLYSGLAQMNNAVHFMQPGMFRDPAKTARTLALAQKAVALDPLDSRAELCLGWALAMSGRYAAAEVHMELACALNANDSVDDGIHRDVLCISRRCQTCRCSLRGSDGDDAVAHPQALGL